MAVIPASLAPARGGYREELSDELASLGREGLLAGTLEQLLEAGRESEAEGRHLAQREPAGAPGGARHLGWGGERTSFPVCSPDQVPR